MKKWNRSITASATGRFEEASLRDPDVLSILNDEDNALNSFILSKQADVISELEGYQDHDAYVSVDGVRRGPGGDYLFTLYVGQEYYDDGRWEDDSYTLQVVYISETDSVVTKDQYEPRPVNLTLNGIVSWESGDENLLKREIPACWHSLPDGYVLRIDNLAGSSYRFVKEDGHMVRHEMKHAYSDHETKSGARFSAPNNYSMPAFNVPDEYAETNIRNAISRYTTAIYILEPNGQVLERATKAK